MPKKYKVLITGSSGMLGADLCRELKKDYRLVGMDVVRRSSFVVRKKFVECDITDKKSAMTAISKAKPDVVIHAAAYTDVDGCEKNSKKAYQINAEGAGNIALSCKKANAALIYISTDFVFNGKKRSPYKESDKPAPLSVYGDSKLQGELAIRKILKNYFIVRTSWLYGQNGKNFVDTIIAKGKTEKLLKVVNDQVGSPTYTRDLARALHVLLDKIFTNDKRQTTNDRIYHVSNSGAVSWYDYAKKILNLTGLKAKIVPISSRELARPARRPSMSVLDCGKFTKFTGHKMRRWDRALKEYVVA
jgi:dTDP-4-dehydrorhamnose reductase